MSELMERFKHMPKWAQIGIPVVLIAVFYYVYSKNKTSSTSGTSTTTTDTGSGSTDSTTGATGATGAAGATGATGATGAAGSSGTATGTSKAAGRLAAWKAYAMKWAAQATKNEKKYGRKETTYKMPGANATAADWIQYAAEMKINATKATGAKTGTVAQEVTSLTGGKKTPATTSTSTGTTSKVLAATRVAHATKRVVTPAPTKTESARVARRTSPVERVAQSKAHTAQVAHVAPSRHESPKIRSVRK